MRRRPTAQPGGPAQVMWYPSRIHLQMLKAAACQHLQLCLRTFGGVMFVFIPISHRSSWECGELMPLGGDLTEEQRETG